MSRRSGHLRVLLVDDLRVASQSVAGGPGSCARQTPVECTCAEAQVTGRRVGAGSRGELAAT